MTDETNEVQEAKAQPILTVYGQVMDDGSVRVGNNLAQDYNMHQSTFEALSIGVATQLLATLQENYSPLLAPLMKETVMSLRKNFPEETEAETVPADKQDVMSAIAKKVEVPEQHVDNDESGSVE